MNTSALIMLIVTQGLVAICTVYFLVKVLTIKPKKDVTDS